MIGRWLCRAWCAAVLAFLLLPITAIVALGNLLCIGMLAKVLALVLVHTVALRIPGHEQRTLPRRPQG
ncbi:MAG: hypothetical protein QE285_02485 [Aquabacterium sp.]|nr:hypothetical protein [Aquabacterium sp.]